MSCFVATTIVIIIEACAHHHVFFYLQNDLKGKTMIDTLSDYYAKIPRGRLCALAVLLWTHTYA
jgi:hypothetical protein